MTSQAYQLKNPITVVTWKEGHHRLVELPAGSIFYAEGSKPDPNGMIDGIYQGDAVVMFSRDLEDRAEPVGEEQALRTGA